jgi:hypothetical protein
MVDIFRLAIYYLLLILQPQFFGLTCDSNTNARRRSAAMRIKLRPILLIFGILILLFAAACSPSSGPVEEGEVTQEVVTEQAPLEIEEGEAPAETEVASAPVSPAGVPEDVPIMEGATNLQVTRGGTNIKYQVDGVIDDVVRFYQEQLPNFGWESAGNPDTQAGKIASMLRINEAGDRISINMQHNELGGFVVVTVTLARK